MTKQYQPTKAVLERMKPDRELYLKACQELLEYYSNPTREGMDPCPYCCNCLTCPWVVFEGKSCVKFVDPFDDPKDSHALLKVSRLRMHPTPEWRTIRIKQLKRWIWRLKRLK